MPKTNAETMTVRLPTQVANELIKLRDDKNLPTIGSALQIYVQQMKEDQLNDRLRKLEAVVSKLEGTVWPVLKETAKTACELASENLGMFSERACRMRDLLHCPKEEETIKECYERSEIAEKGGPSYPEFKKIYREVCREKESSRRNIKDSKSASLD